jgi:hypothetical protein
MTDDAPERLVLARYSFLKVGAWAVSAGAIALSLLREGLVRNWQPPAGAIRPSLYYLGWGAAPFLLFIALALVCRFLLARGVAIARERSNLVLNFPLGRKTVLLQDVTVSADRRSSAAPNISAWIRPPAVAIDQVTFARAGMSDLGFRTALLTENAEVIARRIAAQQN